MSKTPIPWGSRLETRRFQALRLTALHGVLVAGCVGVAGCVTTTYVSVDRLLADVRQDEVAVTTRMKKEITAIEGKVESKGVTSEPAEGGGLRVGGMQVDLDDGDRGYVVLQSSRGNPGRVVCLLESMSMDSLTSVPEGDIVTLSCRFRKLVGRGQERLPVFEDCYVEQQ